MDEFPTVVVDDAALGGGAEVVEVVFDAVHAAAIRQNDRRLPNIFTVIERN